MSYSKNRVRALARRLRRGLVRTFRSYDSVSLLAALRKLGVASGDSVMVHSRFTDHCGFRGTAGQLIDLFLQALGPEGNLLMVSMPYRSSALDYLSRQQAFDVRRTPSAMGLVTEFFRRRPGVLRSVHPTHPVLVSGARAEWFVAGHEYCLTPCGSHTPFDKLLQVGGKVAFFDVPFAFFTFFHYLEDYVISRLDFPLYHEPPFSVPVVGPAGESLVVCARAFGRETLARRRFEILESWLWQHRVIRRVRVGATVLLLVNLKDVMQAVDAMIENGTLFYEPNPLRKRQ